MTLIHKWRILIQQVLAAGDVAACLQLQRSNSGSVFILLLFQLAIHRGGDFIPVRIGIPEPHRCPGGFQRHRKTVCPFRYDLRWKSGKHLVHDEVAFLIKTGQKLPVDIIEGNRCDIPIVKDKVFLFYLDASQTLQIGDLASAVTLIRFMCCNHLPRCSEKV